MHRPPAHVLLAATALCVSLCACSRKPSPKPTAADASVFNNNGVMLLEHDRGDARGAIQLFQRAVAAKPDYALAQTNLGIASYALAAGSPDAKYSDAIAALEKAEHLGGKSANLFYARALARISTRDYAGAERDLQSVLAIDPKDAFTLYHLGLVRHQQRDYAGAAKWFQAAVQRLPDFQSAHYNLGMALMLMGRKDAGQAALARFQRLKESKRGVTVGGEYFAAHGKYMEPLQDTSAPKHVATGHMVAFTDAARDSGLWQSYTIGGRAAPFVAAWGDIDNDTRPDVAIAAMGSVVIYRNTGGRFVQVGAPLTYDGIATGAAWADYDNDGSQDLLLCGSFGLRIYRKTGGVLRDVTEGVLRGVAAAKAPMRHVAWVDYDHDGYLDIVAAPVDGPICLLRNNTVAKPGGGQFADVSRQTGVSAARGSYVLATDFDRNRAVDLLVVSESGKPMLLRNSYDGTFGVAPKAAGLDALGSAHQIAAADLNSDGLIDYVAATDRGVLVATHRRDDTFTVRPIVAGQEPQAVQSVSVADFDNDGNYDVLAVVGQHLTLYRGSGDGTFTDVTSEAGLSGVTLAGASGRPVIADADANGFADVLVPGLDTKLLKNGGNANRWVRLNLRGLKGAPAPQHADLRTGARTNGDGIGSLVEAWTDTTWLTTEVTSSSGDDTEPILGLGSSGNPRWLRVLWTTGVHECEPLGVQPPDRASSLAFRDYESKDVNTGSISRATGLYLAEDGKEVGVAGFKRGDVVTGLPVPINRTVALWEPDRNPTSCPVLYVWDGRRYRFITDLQGGAIVGYNIGEYQYSPNNPDEYVMLPPGSAALRDGRYEVEIADQLQEVLFIDAVHLLAVDHPAGTRVFSNDRMLAGPPYPTFGVWSVDRTHPLRAATDDRGRDVLPLLANIDRRYPEGFEKLPYEGFAREHTLILDLGDTRGAKQILLLLWGWQEYAHSSSNLAAAHGGVFGHNPALQVRDNQGRWRTVIADMGAIAGLPKWLAVDLTGKFPSDDRHVRIVTNLELYWDKAEVGLRMADAPARVTRITPSQADYHWLGYPQPIFPDGRNPVVYDFDRRRSSAPWMTPAGYYTRPGDITPLLQKPDDQYVVMRHGYAMHIAFDARRLPPLPAGWTRDFALYSDGFGKDMDMNGGASMTVDPLPFHSMKRYPYGPNEHYPATRANLEYLAGYNTAYEPGTPPVTVWPELHKSAAE